MIISHRTKVIRWCKVNRAELGLLEHVPFSRYLMLMHTQIWEIGSLRTVKGNQQTAINRGKIHRYRSLDTGTGFITLTGVGRTPSFYSNMCMNLYLRVCACMDSSINHKRNEKGRI